MCLSSHACNDCEKDRFKSLAEFIKGSGTKWFLPSKNPHSAVPASWCRAACWTFFRASSPPAMVKSIPRMDQSLFCYIWTLNKNSPSRTTIVPEHLREIPNWSFPGGGLWIKNVPFPFLPHTKTSRQGGAALAPDTAQSRKWHSPHNVSPNHDCCGQMFCFPTQSRDRFLSHNTGSHLWSPRTARAPKYLFSSVSGFRLLESWGHKSFLSFNAHNLFDAENMLFCLMPCSLKAIKLKIQCVFVCMQAIIVYWPLSQALQCAEWPWAKAEPELLYLWPPTLQRQDKGKRKNADAAEITVRCWNILDKAICVILVFILPTRSACQPYCLWDMASE